MKQSKIALVIISVLVAGLLLASCAGQSTSAAIPGSQIATVQTGNLTIDISANGNLSFSSTAELAFDMTGTVAEVLAEEGDSVEQGQVLAKLDQAEWEEQVVALERKLATTQTKLAAAEQELIQVEINLKNAEVALAKAQDTYKWPEIQVAQAEVDGAKAYLDYVEWNLAQATGATQYTWQQALIRARSTLAAAEAKLSAMTSGADTDEVVIKKLQLKLAEMRFAEAPKSVESAQQDVQDAQKELDDAKALTPAITAPFAGSVTKVNIAEGASVNIKTIAIILSEPNKFQAEILVNEIDIMKIRVGASANMQVDALSGLSLPAKVTHIAPTAVIQGGVVNYRVKVELESMTASQRPSLPALGLDPENLPEALDRAVQEGRITPEMRDRLKERLQQGAQAGERPAVTAPAAALQLKEGLSVNVSVVVQEKKNVLLVPNRAIIRQGDQTQVQVLKDDGTTELRSVQTGLSDWQNTEVTTGLKEGEKVVIQKTSGSTTPTSQQPSLFPNRGLLR